MLFRTCEEGIFWVFVSGRFSHDSLGNEQGRRVYFCKKNDNQSIPDIYTYSKEGVFQLVCVFSKIEGFRSWGTSMVAPPPPPPHTHTHTFFLGGAVSRNWKLVFLTKSLKLKTVNQETNKCHLKNVLCEHSMPIYIFSFLNYEVTQLRFGSSAGHKAQHSEHFFLKSKD